MFARALGMAVLLAGCSYLQLDRPPRAVRVTDRVPGPQCSAAKTWPTVDVVVAIAAVGSGIAYASGVVEPKDEMGVPQQLTAGERFMISSAAIVEGLLFAWSAYYGFETTKACRAMQQRLAAEAVPMQPYVPPGGAP